MLTREWRMANPYADFGIAMTRGDAFRVAHFLPECQLDDWRVTYRPRQSGAAEAGGDGPPATWLLDGRIEMMSDEPEDTDLLVPAWQNCVGSVLLTGLGLGCLVSALLRKSSVTHIDVVESSPTLIELLRPYFPTDRLTFIHGDGFSPSTWRSPGTFWDTAFLDMWVAGGVERVSSQMEAMIAYRGLVKGWLGSYGFHELLPEWLAGRKAGWPGDQ
jgi:hypothetical protein